MDKTVSALKVRQNLGQLINEIYYRGDEFIIKRAGKPMAALVTIEDYQKLIALKKKYFKVFDSIQAKNIAASFDEVAKDVAEAIRKVRSKK